jgi:hypothetical protein
MSRVQATLDHIAGPPVPAIWCAEVGHVTGSADNQTLELLRLTELETNPEGVT